MSELDFDKSLKRGNRGKRVRAIQEWLTLNGFGLVPDGVFGPATQFAVKAFQESKGLAKSGVVTKTTFNELVTPLRTAAESDPAPGSTLGAAVVDLGERHLDQKPREVGGQNSGPWVRYYMNGNEGPPWPWCAGFVCRILRQACDALGMPMPIKASFSCDSLAASAKERNRFTSESTLDKSQLTPGWLFLSRRTPRDWTHVGIVVDTGPAAFLSIEGNTNDTGSREGYEVCRRIRGYKGKDFIRVD